MTKYRQVQVSFWQDNFVLDLTPEEKYFYLYLMTNPKANQIGIYELPLKMMELETGYNRETVEKLLIRFEEYGKIQYSKITKEVILLNWVKHNWNTSIKVITRVSQELEKVKNKDFVNLYIEQAEKVESDKSKLKSLYPIDTVSEVEKLQEIPYGYKEKDKEKEKEKDKEKEKESPSSSADSLESLENYFGSLTQYMFEDLEFYKDKFDELDAIVIEAIEISRQRSVKNWNYTKKIIQDWRNHNLKTLDAVRKHEAKSKLNNYKPTNQEVDLNTEYEKSLTEKLGF